MAPMSPAQRRWRARIELALRVLEPGLDLLLAAGDRLSRAVDPRPEEPVPAIRARRDRTALDRARAGER